MAWNNFPRRGLDSETDSEGSCVDQLFVVTHPEPLLLQVRALAPGLVTGHIAITDPFGNRQTDMLGPWWPWPLLNPRYVNGAHARRQRVCPLDPHLHRRLHRWLALDVDAVLTNDPKGTRCLPTGAAVTPAKGTNSGVRVTCAVIDNILQWCKEFKVSAPTIDRQVYQRVCK